MEARLEQVNTHSGNPSVILEKILWSYETEKFLAEI